MKEIPIKWGRVVIRLTSPEECDQLMDQIQHAKELLEDTQTGLRPPVVSQRGYISRKAFYAFFEQEGLKSGSRGAGPTVFGALARAAGANKLPLGLMYCTECQRAVTEPCVTTGKYDRVAPVNHGEFYQLNVAVLKAKWRELGKLSGIGRGDGTPLAILVQQLNRHGK